MPAADFHLVTEWWIPASSASVWGVLTAPQDWPSWWPAVTKVELLEPGGSDGVGACRRFTWRTALPYTVSFNMRTTRIEPMVLIEGRADGELVGTGRWTLLPDGTGTRVRYDWIVAVTKPWMRALAPLLRPVFAWNHDKVMEWGRAGLERNLAGKTNGAR